jgi:hypothetical protein
MTFQPRTFIIAGVVVVAAIVYTARLYRVPPFLGTDETAFALQTPGQSVC